MTIHKAIEIIAINNDGLISSLNPTTRPSMGVLAEYVRTGNFLPGLIAQVTDDIAGHLTRAETVKVMARAKAIRDAA